MIDKTQIPFLLKLVDDKSPTVRAKVAQALRTFGKELQDEIAGLEITLTPQQRSLVEEIIKAGNDDESASQEPWLNWLEFDNETDRLEAAMAWLAQWQLGPEYAARLHGLLDDLADEFVNSGRIPDPEELSYFLFVEKGLQGAEADDYYNPLNSNLVHVIEFGHGIPISLASVFILVGNRLGLEIYGCNFPGHFLARARVQEHDLLFDCFNEGRVLSESETAALRKAAPWTIETPAPAVVIVARVLGNMALAFEQADDIKNARFMLTLLSELEQAVGL